MHAGLGAQPAVGVVAVHANRRALDTGDFAIALLDDLGAEAACIGPAQVHAQQHLRPVLRLGTARASLDVEKGAARVHLAREHAHELELPQAFLESGRIPLDLGQAGRVVLGDDEFEQFAGIGDTAADAVEVAECRIEFRAFPAEFLRALRRIPDPRVAQLPVQLLESLAFAVVLKGTPSARRGAGPVPRANGVRVRLP